MFAREVKELYLHAKASLENPNADSEDLGTIKIKMKAAVQHLRRLEWALDLTRPCGGDLLELIINQVNGRLAALTRLDLIGSCKCSVAVVAANQRSLFQRSRVTHCN